MFSLAHSLTSLSTGFVPIHEYTHHLLDPIHFIARSLAPSVTFVLCWDQVLKTSRLGNSVTASDEDEDSPVPSKGKKPAAKGPVPKTKTSAKATNKASKASKADSAKLIVGQQKLTGFLKNKPLR